MNAFDYAAPATADLAVQALAGRDGAEPIGGGTDLLCRMKDYVSSPGRLVDLKAVDGLAGIEGDPSSGITLGAATLLADVVDHKGIRESYPALWQATREVGTPQLRNMATVGGNLLQRPRCWFYRAGFGILGMKDGKSLVRGGDNRYHAIFNTEGDALFVCPSSLATALVALGAKATLLRGEGERTVTVEQLYKVPKSEDDREHTLAPGEILTKIAIPAAKGKNASYEVRQKQAHDWPLILASVNLQMDGETVSDARIVLYGVAPIPWRSRSAEKAIQGKTISMASAKAAGEAAVEGAKPLSNNGYKLPLTQTVVKRALLAAVGRRYWEES